MAISTIPFFLVWIQSWFDFASITHLAFRYRDLYTGLMLIHVQIGRRLPHTNRPPTCCTSRQSSGRCSSHTCRSCPAQPCLGAITRITPTPSHPEPVTAGPQAARHWPVRSCPDRWPACSASTLVQLVCPVLL